MSEKGWSTLTIAAFKAGRTAEPTVGTLIAKIVTGTRHVTGDRLTIEDASGTLEVWVPRSLHDKGIAMSKWFAFDVVAEAEPCSVIDLSERSINKRTAVN